MFLQERRTEAGELVRVTGVSWKTAVDRQEVKPDIREMDCHSSESWQQTSASMLQEIKVEVEETDNHLPESPESSVVVVQEEILDHVFPASPGTLEVEKLKHDFPKSPETSEVILQEVKLEIRDKDCDSPESLETSKVILQEVKLEIRDMDCDSPESLETSEVILQDVKLEIGDKDCDSPESIVETSEVLLQDVKLEIKDMDCDSLKSLESSALNLQTRKLEIGEMNCEFSGSFKASAAVILQAVEQEVGDMDCDSPTSPATSELIFQAGEQKPGQLKASEVSSGRDCTKVSEVLSGRDCTKVSEVSSGRDCTKVSEVSSGKDCTKVSGRDCTKVSEVSSGRDCTKASVVHHALLPGYSTLVHTLKAAGHSSSTPVDPAPGRTVGDEAGRQQILTADRRRLVSPQDHHTLADTAGTRGKVRSRKGADCTSSFQPPEKSQEKLPDHQSHALHRLSPEQGRCVSARWRRPTLKGCDYVTDVVSGSGRVKRGSSVKATDCVASDGRRHVQRKQKKAKLQASCSSHSDFSDTSATSSTSATSHTRSRSRPSRSLDFSAKERSSCNEGLGSPSRKLKGQAASEDEHADVDQKQRPFYCVLCAECGKTFPNVSTLKIHSTVHNGKKPHQCPLCDAVFSQKGDVTVHVRRRHTGERPYPCPQADCPKRFHSTSELARHRLMHAKAESISTGKAWPWTCTVCGLRCQHRFSLAEHVQLHSGDSFPCDVCDKTFRRQRSLQRHKKEQHNPQGNDHTSGRTSGPGHYQCEHCKSCYTWLDSLKRHIKVKHSGGQHRFKCPQCPARFPYPSSLKVHSRLHSGECPYVCPPPCGQSFTSNTALSRHQRTQHRPQQTPDATPPSTDTRCNTTLNKH